MSPSIDMNELYLGEVSILDQNEFASISCTMPFACELSLIVQDEDGRTKLDQGYKLRPGNQAFQFSIANLSQGQYHVWIDVADKTFIRTFTINKTDQDNSWMKIVRNFFS